MIVKSQIVAPIRTGLGFSSLLVRIEYKILLQKTRMKYKSVYYMLQIRLFYSSLLQTVF